MTMSGSMPDWMSWACRKRAPHHDQAGEVEQVPAGQQHRLAADLAGQLAEGDDRARERDGTDEDADVDLDFVDGLLGGGREYR
jgi:hypothetical protein